MLALRLYQFACKWRDFRSRAGTRLAFRAALGQSGDQLAGLGQVLNITEEGK